MVPGTDSVDIHTSRQQPTNLDPQSLIRDMDRNQQGNTVEVHGMLPSRRRGSRFWGSSDICSFNSLSQFWGSLQNQGSYNASAAQNWAQEVAIVIGADLEYKRFYAPAVNGTWRSQYVPAHFFRPYQSLTKSLTTS